MDEEFLEAPVMGHDILGLSSGLDSVVSLLGLEPCGDSIYSSGLGLDDIHHEGSVIDSSLVESNRTVFQEELEIAPITLDGLIPFMATHQCPTPSHISGNTRVTTKTNDFATFDGQDSASVDDSGLMTNALSDTVVSSSLSDSQLTFFDNVTSPSLYTEESESINSSLSDFVSSPSFSTTLVSSLNKESTLSKSSQGKVNVCDSVGATSVDISSDDSSFLNTPLASVNDIGTPSKGRQRKSGILNSLINDVIVPTSLSTTPSLKRDRISSIGQKEKANATVDNNHGISVEISGNTLSLSNDNIVSTSQSSKSSIATTSRKRVRNLSRSEQGKVNTSGKSKSVVSFKVSDNVSGVLKDTKVSTSQSSSLLASSKRDITTSNGEQGKMGTCANSRGAIVISVSDSDTLISTCQSTNLSTSSKFVRVPSKGNQGQANIRSKRMTSLALDSVRSLHNIISTNTSIAQSESLKRVIAASKMPQDKGAVLKKIKTRATRENLVQKPILKTNERKKSSTEAASPRTGEMKGNRLPQQKEQKHFKCSSCGAVYKSHALCVKHVLDRHKSGRNIKHNITGILSRNSSSVHVKQQISHSVPHENNTTCLSSDDSSSDSGIEYKVASKRRFGRSQETITDKKNGPSHAESTLRTVKGKCVVGYKRSRSQSPRSGKCATKVNPQLRKHSRERILIDSSEVTAEHGEGQVIADGPDLSDLITTQDPKPSQRTRTRKKKCVACDERKFLGEGIAGKETHKSPSKRSMELSKDVARKKMKLHPTFGEINAHYPSPRPPDPRLTRHMKINDNVVDSHNIPASDKRLEKNPEIEPDCNYVSRNFQRTSSAVESKSHGGRKRKRSKSPRRCNSVPKGNAQSRKESRERSLIYSTEFDFLDDDFDRQEMERASNMPMDQSPKLSSRNYGGNTISLLHKEKRESREKPKSSENQRISTAVESDITKDQNQQQSLKTSGGSTICLLRKVKRENRDMTKGSKNQIFTPQRDPHRDPVTEKKIKEQSSNSERTVYLLEPRQLTIVICPQCQKGFTTYTGYSRHAAQVHKISSSHAPGKLLQLLVQRSPQYGSKTTPVPALGDPQVNELCRKDGTSRKIVEKDKCTSGDILSSSVNKPVSEKNQFAISRVISETSSFRKAISGGIDEGKLCFKSTQTDISFLEEPLCNQHKQDHDLSSQRISRVHINDIRKQGGSIRTSLNDKVNPAVNDNFKPTISPTLDHQWSILDRSNTSNETSSMIKRRESLLCFSCGEILKGPSGLDDNHQLGSSPGELVCKWTPEVKEVEGSSFLCSACGIQVSPTDRSTHSAICGVDVQDSLIRVDDRDHVESSAGKVVPQVTSHEKALPGNHFVSSVCNTSILFPQDFRNPSCTMATSIGLQQKMRISPSSKFTVDGGDQTAFGSSLMCLVSKGNLYQDKARLATSFSVDHIRKQHQDLLSGPRVIKVNQQGSLGMIMAGTGGSVLRIPSGNVSYAMTMNSHEDHSRVSLDNMLKQHQSLLSDSRSIKGGQSCNKQEPLKMIKAGTAGSAMRIPSGNVSYSSTMTSREGHSHVSLDNTLKQCQGLSSRAWVS